MFYVPRKTARLAALVSFAALVAAACHPESKDVSTLAGPTLSASKQASLPSVPAASAPALGTAGSFTILSAAPGGGGTVTCTDGTITGSVGSSGLAASVVQTSCAIVGTIIAPVPAQVVTDFNAAYTALGLKTGVCDAAHTLLSTIPASVTLLPGVYCTGAALTASDVTVTLDAGGNANATWLFKIGHSAVGALTGTNFQVLLGNGAQACNVTWLVDAGTTMTTSDLKGIILSGAAITLTGGTLVGRALAKAGVTVTGTVVTGCVGSSSGTGSGNCDRGHGEGSHHDKDKHHTKGHDKSKHHDKHGDKNHSGASK
jgi:Ice-binding-like